MKHPESTVQIAGHPIHPLLIPFPIVFRHHVAVQDDDVSTPARR